MYSWKPITGFAILALLGLSMVACDRNKAPAGADLDGSDRESADTAPQDEEAVDVEEDNPSAGDHAADVFDCVANGFPPGCLGPDGDWDPSEHFEQERSDLMELAGWPECLAWVERCKELWDVYPNGSGGMGSECSVFMTRGRGEDPDNWIIDPVWVSNLESLSCEESARCIRSWARGQFQCGCPLPPGVWPEPCDDYDYEIPELPEDPAPRERPDDPDAPDAPESIEGPADGADGI